MTHQKKQGAKEKKTHDVHGQIPTATTAWLGRSQGKQPLLVLQAHEAEGQRKLSSNGSE